MKPALRQRLLAAVGLGRRRPVSAQAESAPAAADVARDGAASGGPAMAASATVSPATTPVGPADAMLRRLEWTVIRRLDGLRQGDCRTLMRGAGLDLADLREYQPHDDVRHIDWNVTARLDVPHVRQFQEDRDMTVHLLLDLSSSVNWGTVLTPPGADGTGGVRTKQQVATELVAVLARLFTRSGHRVGALLYRQGAAGSEELPARGGRGQVLQLLTRIARPTESAAALPRERPSRWAPWRRNAVGPSTADDLESTRLADLLQAAEHRLKRRATVIVVSDFISQPGWQAPLARLALRHDVLAVRLSDPSEHDLPAAGLVLLRDAESGEELLVDTDDPALRARHAALAQAQEHSVREGLTAAGVDTLEIGTAEALVDTLRRFLDLRRLRQRRGLMAAPRAGAALQASPFHPPPGPGTAPQTPR